MLKEGKWLCNKKKYKQSNIRPIQPPPSPKIAFINMKNQNIEEGTLIT